MGRSRKPRKPSKPARLTIAIGGEGVSLRDVSLRQLAELLEATAATFEAVALEKQLPVPNVALTKVKAGSAAYELVSEDQGAERVYKSVLQVVRDRGKDSSPRTRRGMSRMLQAAGKTGPLRFEPEATTLRATKSPEH